MSLSDSGNYNINWPLIASGGKRPSSPKMKNFSFLYHPPALISKASDPNPSRKNSRFYWGFQSFHIRQGTRERGDMHLRQVDFRP